MNQKQKSRKRSKSGPIVGSIGAEKDKAPGAKASDAKRSKRHSGNVRSGKHTVAATIAKPLSESEIRGRVIASLLLLIPFIWSYLPTLVSLYGSWMTQPDYSHGILVAPFAIGLLWMKRNERPEVRKSQVIWGLMLLLGSLGLRYFGARLFFIPVDGYSMILWIAGTVWILFGWPVLRWSLPAILFLWFMIPLPYSVSTSLSLPLQRIATILSTWMLQFLGQPAISEGNTILIDEIQLEVANACSGLRVFMGIIALSAAYLMLVKMSYWKRGLLLVSVVPIALSANAIRIVTTGFLYQFESLNVHHQTIHDVSGWLMIPLAAAMFWVMLWYVSKLLPEIESMDLKSAMSKK